MTKALNIVIAMTFMVGVSSLSIAGQKEMKKDPGEGNVPENIQRSSPSAEDPLPGGSGPGTRSDQLTEMEEVDPKDSQVSHTEGGAAQAAKELGEKGQKKAISSKSSSQKSH